MSIARDESDADSRSGSRFQIPPKSLCVIKGFGSDPTPNYCNSLHKFLKPWVSTILYIHLTIRNSFLRLEPCKEGADTLLGIERHRYSQVGCSLVALGKPFNTGWHFTSNEARRSSDMTGSTTIRYWGRHHLAVAPLGMGDAGFSSQVGGVLRWEVFCDERCPTIYQKALQHA